MTSRSAEKRERALGLGADHVIDYAANPEWGDAARAWTGEHEPLDDQTIVVVRVEKQET